MQELVSNLGVFYYGWWGGKDNPSSVYRHWKDDDHNPPIDWNARYLPNMSGITTDPKYRLYDSWNQKVVQRQMNMIYNASIGFVIWSWWGQTHFTQTSLDKWFNNPNNPEGLKHCIYYEKEWLDTVSEEEIISDINFLKSKYMSRTRWYKIGGKPVVFVYNTTPTAHSGEDPEYQQTLTQKWNSVRQQTGIYTVLKVWSGWESYKSYSNSWHQYGPSTAYQAHKPYSSYISPGWWAAYEDSPRLARNPTTFEANARIMKADGCALHTIQTWNEWTEGTGIEPAKANNTGIEHGTTYVDIIDRVF